MREFNHIIWIRTILLKDILLESEKEILYWRGIEIARQEDLSDYLKLKSFFQQNGLGTVEYIKRSNQSYLITITHSPLCAAYEAADAAIQLECGLVTGAFQIMYHRNGTGHASWICDPASKIPYIEVVVTLCD